MMPTVTFLDDMRAAAEQADGAEAAFRREIASRIAALEQERAFAYRRVNLMQTIADAVAQAEDMQLAGAVAQAALRVRLGWDTDSEARSAVLTEFAAVGRAVFAAMSPGDEEGPPDDVPADVPAALATFERWYAEHHAKPFWVLFEQYIPETPRVDF